MYRTGHPVIPQLGLGACCDSCKHGGACSGGMGLFDSGLSPTTWGWSEWLVIGLGGYMLTSMFFGAQRGVRAAGEGVRRGVKRGRRRLAEKVAGD